MASTTVTATLDFAPSVQVEALYDTALLPGFVDRIHKLANALDELEQDQGSSREGESAAAVYSAVEFLADEFGIRVAA